MRILAVVAALVPLLTLPAMADRAAVDKCKSEADKAIAGLNGRVTAGSDTAEDSGLQKQLQEAVLKRAACERKPNDLSTT